MSQFDFNVIIKHENYKTEEEQLQYLVETIKTLGLPENDSATKTIKVMECSEAHAKIQVEEKDADGSSLSKNLVRLETDLFGIYGRLKEVSLSNRNELDWKFGTWRELSYTYWINGENVDFERFRKAWLELPRKKPLLIRTDDENAKKAIAAMWAHILGKPAVELTIWIDYVQNVAFIMQNVEYLAEFEFNEVVWRLIHEDDRIIAFKKLVKANKNDEINCEE